MADEQTLMRQRQGSGCGLNPQGRWPAHAAMAQGATGGLARTFGYMSGDADVQAIWAARASPGGWSGDAGVPGNKAFGGGIDVPQEPQPVQVTPPADVNAAAQPTAPGLPWEMTPYTPDSIAAGSLPQSTGINWKAPPVDPWEKVMSATDPNKLFKQLYSTKYDTPGL